MSQSNCQYLYLSNSQATKTAGFVTWNNIPSMSQSTRECYVTAVRLNVVFTQEQSHNDIIVKTPIPTMNYTATDNSEPLIAVLHSDDSKLFVLNIDNPVHLLSNDNIKSFKLTLLQTDESATGTPSACNVLLKFDYIDQVAYTNDILLDIPRQLK
tara:strand:+ start:295 stop:759 length:465 start_codon:yes stop_codon:yes gene_type:complete